MDLVEIRCSGGVAHVPLDVPTGMQVKNWRQGRFYEAPFLEYLRKTYHGGTWVDAGSAIGNHALFMARFCDCERVISIDPVGPSLELQARILTANGVREAVRIVHCALSDWNGRGEMKRIGPGVGHWQLHPDPQETGVLVTTLDDLGLRNVVVLKLDVEWSELAALRGASRLLREQQPAVFTEANGADERDAIDYLLRPMGYEHGRRFHTMHEWVPE